MDEPRARCNVASLPDIVELSTSSVAWVFFFGRKVGVCFRFSLMLKINSKRSIIYKVGAVPTRLVSLFGGVRLEVLIGWAPVDLGLVGRQLMSISRQVRFYYVF